MRASGRQGQCTGLGQQSQLKTWGAQMESSYLPIPSVSLWTKGLLSSFHPWSTPHWNSSWLPWLPGYLMMIAGNGLTQNLCLSSPYIYLLRTMRSHTLQSDWSAGHSPSQWWLCGLRHHNVPLCPSTWVNWCWGRPWYNFLTPDTSVSLILGSGVSGAWCFFSWHSGFPSVPFIVWLICPPSTLLPPPSLYEPLPNTFHSKSVPQSRLVISYFDYPLLSGGFWGV